MQRYILFMKQPREIKNKTTSLHWFDYSLTLVRLVRTAVRPRADWSALTCKLEFWLRRTRVRAQSEYPRTTLSFIHDKSWVDEMLFLIRFDWFWANIYLNRAQRPMYKGFQARYMVVEHIPIMYLTCTLSCTFRFLYIAKVYVGVYDRYMSGTCLRHIYLW